MKLLFDRQIYCFSAQTNGGTSCQTRELNWLLGFQNLCLTRRKLCFIVPQDFDFNSKEITRQESHFQMGEIRGEPPFGGHRDDILRQRSPLPRPDQFQVVTF